jgi:hypothetical protein
VYIRATRAPRALGFVPSRVFMLYRSDNCIQIYSAKNHLVFGLGSSFGGPQPPRIAPKLHRDGPQLPRCCVLLRQIGQCAFELRLHACYALALHARPKPKTNQFRPLARVAYYRAGPPWLNLAIPAVGLLLVLIGGPARSASRNSTAARSWTPSSLCWRPYSLPAPYGSSFTFGTCLAPPALHK